MPLNPQISTWEEALSKLKERQILSPQAVETLRQAHSPHDFATKVHLALDRAISHLYLEDAPRFKRDLLTATVHRRPFSIDHGDVATHYTKTALTGAPAETVLQKFSNWLVTEHQLALEPYVLRQWLGLNESSAQHPVQETPATSLEIQSPPARKPYGLAYIAVLLLVLLSTLILDFDPGTSHKRVTTSPGDRTEEAAALYRARYESRLPFPYKPYPLATLSEWLKARQSALSEATALQVLDLAAKHYNIDLLLLVAVAGQEQGFVPTTHPKAHLMLNNPFNVYGSWTLYNTDLKDAATIAARTLDVHRQGCPHLKNPYQWINRNYAQDPLWWRGVQHFHLKLTHYF